MDSQIVGMVLGVMLVSFVMSVVFWLLHRRSGRAWGAVGIVLTFLTFLALPYFSSLYVLACGVLTGIAGMCLRKDVRFKTRALATTACLLGAFFVALVPGLLEFANQRSFEKVFPIVSLSERLDFEDAGRQRQRSRVFQAASTTAAEDRTQGDSAVDVSGSLSSVTEERLTEFETPDPERSTLRRRGALQALHEGHVSEFTFADGFGVTRMRPMSRRLLTLENDMKQEELDRAAEEGKPAEESYFLLDGQTIRRPESSSDTEHSQAARPSLAAINEFHFQGLRDFVDTERFGYVASKQRAAGFQSHAFRQELPKLWASGAVSRWRVARLELVSMLRFDEPRVYESKQLPKMDRLKTAPTRPLNPFEQASLPKLSRDEDVVISEEGDRILMLGSLRAAKQCLGCHSVERGELLGAFSYELRPAGG